MSEPVTTPAPPPSSASVFGTRMALAERYVDLLAAEGVKRGLIGPREVDRLWERHVLNSAVVGELIPCGATVVDVGSGAGLPGIPLAIARPDLTVTLMEPMARRVAWLGEVVAELALPMQVVRGRAEEDVVRQQVGACDIAVARALAPLARLASWCLPLIKPAGRVLALKGASVSEEIARDQPAVLRAGGKPLEVMWCGEDVLDTPTTVAVIELMQSNAGGGRRRRRRKDR
ncbi:MAG: 16S rRNA (guanine(527)-N(7))-methyltransferase RsmG [Sciscionella sp.]